MALGDFGGVYAALGQLDGVTGAAGVVFFWSYMLLVFLVLLNFLLAIIVDAFGVVGAGCTAMQCGCWFGVGRVMSPGMNASTHPTP
jgi:hypothetical protein